VGGSLRACVHGYVGLGLREELVSQKRIGRLVGVNLSMFYHEFFPSFFLVFYIFFFTCHRGARCRIARRERAASNCAEALSGYPRRRRGKRIVIVVVEAVACARSRHGWIYMFIVVVEHRRLYMVGIVWCARAVPGPFWAILGREGAGYLSMGLASVILGIYPISYNNLIKKFLYLASANLIVR